MRKLLLLVAVVCFDVSAQTRPFAEGPKIAGSAQVTQALGYTPNNPGAIAFKLGNGALIQPSATPTNSYMDLIVPTGATFIDNVMSIQNNTNNGASTGNAAFRFIDNVGAKERGAIGYSHVVTGNTGGFIGNLLYNEVGNLTASDPDDTDWAVISTHGAGATNFPSTQVQAARYVTSTGNWNFATQGSGKFNFNGPTAFTGNVTSVSGTFPPPTGAIGTTVEASLGMNSSLVRLRERVAADRVALTTNITSGGAQDNAALPSWALSIGGGGGDSWGVARSPAGSGSLSTLFIQNTSNAIFSTNITFDANGTRNLGGPALGANALYMDYTNTATVGNVTINKGSGRVNLAAAGTTLTVTNSHVTAATHCFVNPDGAPGNAVAVLFYAVPAAGSFAINAVPAVTNQTAIDFFCVNAD